ncbi:MAG: hypothetical protein L0229_03805 [Blastocatellia bacterium]|nr:hypothetical protein [Blastocatellia bacterium]
MTTFLFWNIHNKQIGAIIRTLAERHKVDVLILAECQAPGAILAALNSSNKALYYLNRSQSERIRIFTRNSRITLAYEHIENKFIICRLSIPKYQEILLVAVHALNGLHSSQETKKFEAARVAQIIRDVEARVGHARTLLVGDLNMNPFEVGVYAAAAFHSVMTRKIALKKQRKVQGRYYPFFYNPMWGLFGDSTQGPPGTYYGSRSNHDELFWHMIDQVLIRPDLLNLFRNEELRILTEDGRRSFLSRSGLPNASIVSDHLPVLFKLNR